MSQAPRRADAGRAASAKRLCTSDVRYPGLDPSVLSGDSGAQPIPEPEPLRFGEVRDAGIRLGDGRRARARSTRRRLGRQWTVVFCAVAVLAVFASASAVSVFKTAARTGAQGAGGAAVAEIASADRGAAAWLSSAAAEMTFHPRPTPVFAAFRDLQIRLPVRPTALTELAFHQAAFAYAFRLKTYLPTASLDKAEKKHGTGRTPATNVTDDGRISGSVLRFWRPGRPGKPDTAADVGALAGSPVLAPVSGRVLRVRRYQLYGKYDDIQVHIGPFGQPDVDVVLIHLDNVTVKAGDLVEAGITQIGAVRRLSNLMSDLELANYTPSPGDHTHLQLNDIRNPQYKGLTEK